MKDNGKLMNILAARKSNPSSRFSVSFARLPIRILAVLAISIGITLTAWSQQDGQNGPGGAGGPGGAPSGAPGGPDGPGGSGGPGGGPGGPGGDGNMGAAAAQQTPVSSAAKLAFADYDKATHKDAVDTVYDFGLMEACSKGQFCPDRNLSLGELTKAVVLSTQLLQGSAPKDFIAYGVQKGLLQSAAGTDKSVTGYEAAAALLAALGVKGASGQGGITAALKEHDLLQGIEGMQLSQPITRDNAAQMIANALRLSDGSGMIPRVLHNASVGVDGGSKTVDGYRIFFLGGTAVQDTGDSTLIVRNSRIDGDTSTETKPLSGPPGGLLVGGSMRTTLTLGQAQSFYINSKVNSRNWAALSTDAAKPVTATGQKELAVYAYGTKAKTLDGGYGTYSDLFCNIYLFGTKIDSAEIGVISGTYGKVTINTIGAGEANNELAAHLTDADKNQWNDKSTGSNITGGRNALMIHTVTLPPYWAYKGYSKEELPLYSAPISIHGSTLATDLNLNKKVDYSAEQQAYIDHQAGSVIVIKSANAAIDLDKVTLNPDRKGTGALIHTVINNDTGFMTKVPDGTTYPGVQVKMTGMKAEGNVLNEDYQRDLHLLLAETSLTGKIVSGTVETWNALCKEKGMEKYIIDPGGYKAVHGVELSLGSGSSWTVTGDSTLTALTISGGATVKASAGARLTMTVDGAEAAIQTGTYKGKILIHYAR
jgi:hypothetical protein